MRTIRRTWTKQVAEIKTRATACKVYDQATGNMKPTDPANAWAALERGQRATLVEGSGGDAWTVHVHSNLFYKLTAGAPADAPAERDRGSRLSQQEQRASAEPARP